MSFLSLASQVIKPSEYLLNKILDEVYKNVFINSSFECIEYDKKIYHYTSADNIPKIIGPNNSICIRFTDYRFLNDESEGREIWDLFLNCLKDKLNKKEISNSFYNNAKTQLKNAINSTSNLYVACFSMNKDSLPMWNYYLKENKYEGYSLGFDFKNHLESNAIIKRKVVYDDKEKKEIILSIIDEIIENFSEQTEEEKVNILVHAINNKSLVMKKSCFSHEKEVRLILNLNLLEKDNKDFQCGSISYFQKNGTFVPYCDVTWNNKSIFKEICYAPTMNPEQTELGIRSLLKSFGYDKNEYKLFKSKIPVRY